MRSSLLASLALTATLTSAFAPSIADACGGYMRDPAPAVFAVSNHSMRAPGTETWQNRAFVVLGAAGAPAESPWTVLSPTSFSGAQVSDLPDPKESRTFTLVGPSGAQVVSTNRSTLFSRSHSTEDAQTALEVDVGARTKFRIAVLGVQPHAMWLAATETEATPQNKKWVQQQGLDATYVYASKIQGTKIQVFSAHQPNDIGLTSLIVVDGNSMGAHIGTPIGALRMGNKSYVILETNGMITPVAV